MPYPWKTTARKLSTESITPEFTYQPQKNDLPYRVLTQVLHFSEDADIENFSLKPDPSLPDLDENITVINSALRELQSAVKGRDPKAIKTALRTIGDNTRTILRGSSDMSKAVVAQAARLAEQAAFAQNLIDAHNTFQQNHEAKAKQCADMIVPVDLNSCDQFTWGIISFPDATPEQKKLVSKCQTAAQTFNENVGRQQAILDTQYEKYLERQTYESDRVVKDSPEERTAFEAEYYQKFRRYRDDFRALHGFLDTLAASAKSLAVRQSPTDPDDIYDALAKDLSKNVPTKDMFPHRQAILVALVENAGKEPLDKNAIEQRIAQLRNDTPALSSLYEDCILAPVKKLDESLRKYQQDYQFENWRELVDEQEKLSFGLAGKYAVLEQGIRDRAKAAAKSADKYAKNFGRSRPFYAAIRTQFAALDNELQGMSTKSLGRDNSVEFHRMMQTVGTLGNPDDLPDPMTEEAKALYDSRLNYLVNESKAYINAKKQQKGIDPKKDPDKEPSFHTTQGRKRYEYAKRVYELAEEMRKSLTMVNLMVNETGNALKTSIHNSIDRNRDISDQQIRGKYQKNAAPLNLSEYIDHCAQKFYKVKNLLEQENLKNEMKIIDRELTQSKDPKETAKKLREKVNVMCELGRIGERVPTEEELAVLDPKQYDKKEKEKNKANKESLMKKGFIKANDDLKNIGFLMFQIPAKEHQAANNSIVELSDQLKKREAKLSKVPQEQKVMGNNKDLPQGKVPGAG